MHHPDRKQLHYKLQGSRGSWPKEEAAAAAAKTFEDEVDGRLRRSSNQVEMIGVGDLLVRGGSSQMRSSAAAAEDSDDRSSLVVAQQKQQQKTDRRAAADDEELYADEGLLLFCGIGGGGKAESCNAGSQIAENQPHQQLQLEQQQQQRKQKLQLEQFHHNHNRLHQLQHYQKLIEPSCSSSSSTRISSRLQSQNSKMSPLKSAIFAANALNEDDLNKLAGPSQSQASISGSRRRSNADQISVISGGSYAFGLEAVKGAAGSRAAGKAVVARGGGIENHLKIQKQQQPSNRVDLANTDCGGDGGNLSTRNEEEDMINRQYISTALVASGGVGGGGLPSVNNAANIMNSSGLRGTHATMVGVHYERGGSDATTGAAAELGYCCCCSSCDRLSSSVQAVGGGSMGVNNQQQQQPAVVCQDAAAVDSIAERGGPTPTNDLIRTLIQRDRLAMLHLPSQPNARKGDIKPLPSELFESATAIVSDGANDIGSSSGIEYPPSHRSSLARPPLAPASDAHHYHQKTEAAAAAAAAISGNLLRQASASASTTTSPAVHNISTNDTSAASKTAAATSGFPLRAKLSQEASQTPTPTPPSSASSASGSSGSSSSSGGGDNTRGGKGRARLSSSFELATKADPKRQAEVSVGDKCSRTNSGDTTAIKKERQNPTGFDLSALIGKCQRLQLSPLDNIAPYQLAWRTFKSSMSPSRHLRRPSEAAQASPELASALQKGGKASGGSEIGQQRRHSTYLFPLLLNQAPTSDDEDDDDEGESLRSRAGKGKPKRKKATQKDNDGNGSESNDDDDDGGRQVTTGLGEGANININNNNNTHDNININSQANQASQQDGGYISISARNSLAKLRTSTSSPSALNTPTNEQPPLAACSCCNGKQLNGKQLADTQVVQSQSSAIMIQQIRSTPRRGLNLRKLSAGSRRASLASEQMVEQINSRRKRLDSNGQLEPLVASCCRGAGAGATGRLVGAKKRHSLIGVLSGGSSGGGGGGGGSNQAAGGGNQLVSRWLSHPRSLFSSSSSASAAATGSVTSQAIPYRQRASLEGMEEHYDPLIPESGFKIVVMGTSGSGKTSIIQRFAYNSFSWHHNPTVEDTYFIEFPHMKNTINISISDTSGTYQFPAMRKLAINSGDAFILVFSVDNPRSLDDLEQLRQSILDEREQAYSEASASSMSNNSSCSGLESGGSSGSQLQTPTQHYHNLEPSTAGLIRELSPSRHWSLASIFNSHQHHQHLQQLHEEHQTVATNQFSNNNNNNNNNHHHHQHHHSNQNHSINQSLNSSFCSSSCSSSADNSRRSSVSAAEAALKTRRTRHPPMVIVANKQDLPDEQHLVNSDEIEALALIDWNNGFVRASAALNLNIDEIFQQVLKQARQPPTLSEAIVSKRRKSLPPKLPQTLATTTK